MHVPVIWRSRRLFRDVSMSDEATCVGIALHAVIFDKLMVFLAGLLNSCFASDATATTVPFRAGR